jgi:hypothetical protein
VEADGLINLFVNLLAACDVMRCKPAADSFGLQVGIKAIGELLIFAGVADEAGVVLDGFADERADVGDKAVGNTRATQEDLGDFSSGSI